MQMEHHPDYGAFCRTDSYQQWLATWNPPTSAHMDHWADSVEGIWNGVVVPRHWLTRRWGTRLPFYLLDTLEIGSRPCVDIGCGHNWFREHYPSIWGVDPHCEPHRNELLTPEWWIANWGRWPRAFSCCAMHFCDLDTVADNMLKARGILAAGGRAFVALNRANIQERTQDYSEHRLRDTLEAVPGLTRMVWLDSPREAGMDGNVWLWLAA